MMDLKDIISNLEGRNFSEVARATGFTRAYISAIYKGTKNNPSYAAIKSISDYLESNPADVKIGEPERFSIYVKSFGYNMIGNYVNARTKVKIECPNGHEYKVTSSSFKQGKRCPLCTPINQIRSYLYIIPSLNVAKFGITSKSDVMERINLSSSTAKREVILIGSWVFADSASCKKAESDVKENLDVGVIDKDLYPDGYTETVRVVDIDRVIEIFNINGKREKGA